MVMYTETCRTVNKQKVNKQKSNRTNQKQCKPLPINFSTKENMSTRAVWLDGQTQICHTCYQSGQ